MSITSSKRIILASGSPRRHYLLNMIGIAHEVITADVDESPIEGLTPTLFARHLASQKVQHVAGSVRADLIIGADTIVVLDDVILGKPESPEHARSMLATLSGRTHEVITAVAMLTPEMVSPHVFHVVTEVTFSILTKNEIDSYVAGGSPMDKAGSYGIQDDLGSLFVSSIRGDYYNVVGLPIHALYQKLKLFVPEIADEIMHVARS